MDFHSKTDIEDLQAAAEYIFLPPKLPQKAPSDDKDRRINIVLCHLTVEAIHAYTKHLPGSQRAEWHRLHKTLKNLKQFADIPIETLELKRKIAEMHINDILALHIRAQNAAIIIRKRADKSVFEVFEASPLASAVMGSEGRLVCSYPGPAVQIPSFIAEDDAFLGELASFLEQMDIDVLDSMPTTTKAGSTVREERETAHPRYISELLIGILRGAGHIADVPRISKRIADDVLWRNALKPWRRAPLWLIIRVTMQTSLPTAEYKAFMVFMHAEVLKLCVEHHLNHDLLFVMRAKMARRLYKLGSAAPRHLIQDAQEAVEATETVLQTEWTNVQRKQATSASWDPQSLDFAADTAISLPHSRQYLSAVLLRDRRGSVRRAFVPEHVPRSCKTQRFHDLAGDVITKAFAADAHVALVDFEQSVQDHLEEWISRKVNDVSACAALASCFHQYFASAKASYKSNPEDESIMILTILDLWMGLDRLAVAQCPLLREYPPEIPPNFLEPLLLRRSKDITRSITIENYIRKRGDEATKVESVFSDKASPNSFAIRYFLQSQDLRKLKLEIERAAEDKRRMKVQELERKTQEYRSLQAQASAASHTYRGWRQHHKAKKCGRCILESRAESMKIDVHEWPLPSDSLKAYMVVFELHCPLIFSTWREITHSILTDIGSRSFLVSARPEILLEDYAGLRPWAPTSRRITLGSTTKSFTTSHYKSVAVVDATSSNLCVNNGLTFRLFDKTEGAWASGLEGSTVVSRCTPTLSPKGPYHHLQYAVDGTNHTSNHIIATQSQCPGTLGLHEHFAFASLRSGPRLQWLNIARELSSPSLNFNSEDVETLIAQAAWQMGPLSPEGVDREWETELKLAEFGEVILRALRVRLEAVGSNWLQGVTVKTIISLTSRLLASASDTDVRQTAYNLLRNARSLTFQWTGELAQLLRDSVDEGDIVRHQSRVCEMAAICCATYDVDPIHIHSMLHGAEDISIFVQCAIAVHDNTPLSLDTAAPNFRKLMSRHRRTLHALEPALRDAIRSDAQGLNDAMAAVWSSFEPGPTGWDVVAESPWLTSLTASGAAEQGAQRIHYNMLEGRLLVDGQPLGRLPREIVMHPTYTRLFGLKVLDVIPASVRGMEFATRTRISGYQVYFARENDVLVIQARRNNFVFELVPHTVLQGDLPTSFVDNMVHWLNLTTRELQFRPIRRPWREDSTQWRLLFSATSAHPSTLTRAKSSVQLVDIHSMAGRMIANEFECLEHAQYILVTYDPSSRRVMAELPRFRLSFEMNKSMELEAQSLPGMIVDDNQSSGTLFGLQTQLVLRAKDVAEMQLPKSRRILVPYGTVNFTHEDSHTRVDIDTGTSPKVKYYEYEIDNDLGFLVSDGSLASKLFKCYLHAVTSHCLPDPLTKRTGTEEALRELQAQGTLSFQRLEAADHELLLLLSALTPGRRYYPIHRKSMQTVGWSPLPSLAQHHRFRPAVRNIMDFAKSLECFSDHSAIVDLADDTIDEFLTRRCARRNSVFYACENGCFSEEYTTRDQDYYGRDVPSSSSATKDDEYEVFKVSQAILRPSNLVPFSSYPLVETISKWHHVGHNSASPRDQIPSLSYSSHWLNLKLEEQWINLYDLCRDRHTNEAANKFRMMFSLCAITYGSAPLRPFVPVLLAFAVNPAFRSLDPPQWPYYELESGSSPTSARIESLVLSGVLALPFTPAAHITREVTESEADWRGRQRHFYNRERKAHEQRLVYALMSRKLSADIHLLPTDFHQYNMWFDLRRGWLSDVEEYFKSCFRNRLFLDHIAQVQKAIQAGAVGSPVVGIRYRFDRGAGSGVFTHAASGIVNLNDLLAVRHVAVKFIPGQFRTDNSMIPMRRHGPSLDTSGLEALLSEFRGNRGNDLHQQYGEDLEASRKDLQAHFPSGTQNGFPSLITLRNHRLDRQEHLQNTFTTIQQSLLPESSIEKVLSLAGLWPRLTPRSVLDKLSYPRRNALTHEWCEGLTTYAQAFMEYQQSQRLMAYTLRGKLDELLRETDTEMITRDEALRQPDWLLIQIDANIAARPIQVAMAHEMINPSSRQNTVMQLNMGEGKSSVIVPMVAASLADGSRLVRVVVLKALSNQMFRLLIERLGGLAGRRVFYLPFSRNIQVDVAQVRLIQSLYERCVREGGILVAQPEHILSLKLMSMDRLLSWTSPEERELAEALQKSAAWLRSVSRDVLDESDEILHVRYQLVYTAGEQKPIENHPDRWLIIQDIFSSIKRLLASVSQRFPEEIELEGISGSSSSFPSVRILGPHAAVMLNTLLTDEAMNGLLPTLSFALLPLHTRHAARRFLSENKVPQQVSRMLEEYCRGSSTWQALLLLRGMLTEGTGIITYVLEQRRWRVDYGLDPTRSLLAVPYRAKDMPSLRAEFGHPDVVIALTCLSYYYSGLTESQLRQSFHLLMKLDNPNLEFEQWTSQGDDIPPTFRQLSAVNMMDSDQFDHLLMPVFSRNKGTIDFFLSQLVFPREAKQFEYKLAATGWDLAEEKQHVTTGFSGTNDNRYLLPLSISQQDPVRQLRTNALVLHYLLQPENRQYLCSGQSHQDPLTAKNLLAFLVRQKPEIRVLLDVGAQIVELQNEELAAAWLSLRHDVAAAIFFSSDSGDLTVLSQDGTLEPFISSPFKQQLDKCVVYLDDAHTRGTDLKLPLNFRAAVTLGPKVTKDRLIQGCMRMRQLGKGHSVAFYVPPEVDRHIKKAAGLGPGDTPRVLDILRWTMLETCDEITRHAPEWALQGLDFRRRQLSVRRLSSLGEREALRHVWLQREARTLEEMYEPTRCSNPSIQAEVNKFPALRDRLLLLGVTSVTDSRTTEEQEREVNHEIEVEQQVERPPEVKPATHQVSSSLRRLVRRGGLPEVGADFIPLSQPLTSSGIHHASWSKNLLTTRDFATTIVTSDQSRLSDYLRPVHWILSLVNNQDGLLLVALSPFEANALLPDIRRSNAVRLHIYSPRVARDMPSFSDLRFYTVPAIEPRWSSGVPQLVQSQLDLWAGQLYLDSYDVYTELCAFLGIDLEAAHESGEQKQSDGFVLPQDRQAGGQIQTHSRFQTSPLPVLRELFSLRRKGMTYLGTHIGQVLHSRRLTEKDFQR